MMSRHKSILTNSILIIASTVMIFPMIWMIIYSLKSFPESYKSFIDLISAPFTTKNYTDALQSDAFLRYFANSIIIASCVTIGNIFFCFFAAFALVRKEFIGKNYFTRQSPE